MSAIANGVKNGGDDDEELYKRSLLKELDWEDGKHLFTPLITPTNPGDNLSIRPLQLSDYDRGFPQVLSHLTDVGEVSREQFIETFRRMKEHKDVYFITVVVDELTDRIVGSSTLFVEQKFIHSCALRGRIEDVVVDASHRGKQLGKLIVEVAKQLGRHVGCYKISLDCRNTMAEFYSQMGFIMEDGNSNSMTIRYQ